MTFANDQMVQGLLVPFTPYLADPNVTEIAVNRPGELWTMRPGGWVQHECTNLTLGHLESLTAALVSYNEIQPKRSVSVMLPGGYRGHIVAPPVVTDGGYVMMVRKHLPVNKSVDQLSKEGTFDTTRAAGADDLARLDLVQQELLDLMDIGDWAAFLCAAVTHRKNIVIAGQTGSGKTTLARSLVQQISKCQRIVTIEDVHELTTDHPNRVHLLYGSGTGKISATEALALCMRLSPDRIMLSELRGDEAWDYVSSCDTGHPGSITTVHAESALRTFSRITRLIQQSPAGRGIDAEAIRSTLYDTLDVIVYMRDRKVTEVFYDPIFVKSRAQK